MTTSAVVQTFLYMHIGVILVVTAYYAMAAAVAPRLTERGRSRFARRPWLPVLLGLVISLPWVLFAIALLSAAAAPVKFAGAALGCLWILCGLMGGAGIAQHVGRGGADGPCSWVQTVRGGLFISLTWILPLVGWMIMLPMTLAAGTGCLAMGFVPLRGSDRGQASGVRDQQSAGATLTPAQ